MFSTSKCVLKNRKLLEAISYKVQNVSLLHVCKNYQLLKERKILCLFKNNGCSGIVLKPFYATRTITTKDVGVQVTSAETNSNLLAGTLTDSVANASTTSNVSTAPKLETVTDSTVKTSVVSESPQPEITNETLDFPIPEPPAPKPSVIESQVLEDGTTIYFDPPFEQLGLGGWTPAGWVQTAFEYLHCNLGLPWWECIVIGTIFVRTALFPLMILSQRNAARLQNHQPQFQELQLKVNQARQRGDQFEAARLTQDLVLFMREKGINPIKSALIPLCQAPVFLSFFLGLREMANIPLKSMHNGGILWFTDLTVPDQFYILPIFTSLTLLTTIELGVDSGKMTNQNHFLVRYLLRGIPIVMLPFTINFPAAILTYWTGNNLLSLMQVMLFKVPRIRTYFKIPPKIKHSEETLPLKPKGFINGVKSWWKDTRTQNVLADRSRKTQMTFNQAGRGAVPKTYKYDPTLPRTAHSSSTANAQAKKQ